MAYDEELARRIRDELIARAPFDERKMFGGVAFMVCGHMCVGLAGDALMVRVGAAFYEKALSLPHARPMDFTGKPLKGYVYVDVGGLRTAKTLGAWLKRALDFVATLPPKKPQKRKPRPFPKKARGRKRATSRARLA